MRDAPFCVQDRRLRFYIQRGRGGSPNRLRAIGSIAPTCVAQLDDFAQHTQAIVNQMDLASFVMVPSHRNLTQPQAGAARQVEQLDIKTESIDSRRFDNRTALRHLECFETTLRVPKRQARRRANDQIKNPPRLLAPPRERPRRGDVGET